MSNTISESIARRVQLGIEYLCDVYGGDTGLDWLSTVNATALRMGDGMSCVLGQVTGCFATSSLVVKFGFEYASECGFYLTMNDIYAGFTYDDLTSEWKRRIVEFRMGWADERLRQETLERTDSWREV